VQPSTCTWGFMSFCEKPDGRAVTTSSGPRLVLQTGHLRIWDDGGRHCGQPAIAMILWPVGESRIVVEIRSPGASRPPQRGHVRCRSGALTGETPANREIVRRRLVRKRSTIITAATRAPTAPTRELAIDNEATIAPAGGAAYGVAEWLASRGRDGEQAHVPLVAELEDTLQPSRVVSVFDSIREWEQRGRRGRPAIMRLAEMPRGAALSLP